MKISSKLPAPRWVRHLIQERQIRDKGWNARNLQQVYQTFQRMIGNYSRLTGRPTPLNLIFLKENSDFPLAAVALKRDAVIIYLSPGVEIIRDLGPKMLAQELSKQIFEDAGIDSLDGIRSRLTLSEGEAMIEECVQAMDYYLREERCLMVNQSQLKETIESLAHALSYETIRTKATYLIQGPRPPAHQEIIAEIADDIRLLEHHAGKSPLKEEEAFSWQTITLLAFASVIARKYGCAPQAIECQARLFGKLGADLALVELTNLVTEIESFDHSFTLEAIRRASLPEFNLLFNHFVRILSFYFDHAELLIRRISS